MNRALAVLIAMLGTVRLATTQQAPSPTVPDTVTTFTVIVPDVSGPSITGCPSAAESSPPTDPIKSTDFVEVEQLGMWPGRIRIHADGRLVARGGQVTFPFTTQIKPEEAIAVIEKYRASGFWSLCRNYRMSRGSADGPWDVTTIQWGGRVRIVSDRDDVGPSWLRDLHSTLYQLGGGDLFRRAPSPSPVFKAFMSLISSNPRRSLESVRSDLGGNFDAVDPNGWTFLMYATQSPLGVNELQEVLRIANPNIRSYTGETALMLASSSSRFNPDWIRGLITAGADVNAQNDDGQTALMFAGSLFARYPSDRVPEIISILRSAGARTDVRDKAGLTALDYFEESMKGMNSISGDVIQRVSSLLR